MKLLWVKFKNFRLLHDIELNFASNSDSKLTVVRAANESGKTTMLHALQWALYGERALPEGGKGFRFSPIDCFESEVGVSAEIRFEVTKSVAGGPEVRQEYLIVRTAKEKPADISSKSITKSTAQFFEVKPGGHLSDDIGTPGRMIDGEIPLDLREVFFTDGDRALSFIDTDGTNKKNNRVEDAINILLGINVIQVLIRRITRISNALDQTEEITGNTADKLGQVQRDIEKKTTERESLQEKLSQIKTELSELEQNIDKLQLKIDEILQKGDEEQLAKDRKASELERKNLRELLEKAKRKHSDMFRGQGIAIDLLKPKLNEVSGRLDALHDQGKMPQITIPILEECIAKQVCVCGETLSEDDQAAIERLRHVEKLISDNRESDDVQKILTELYYEARPLFSAENVAWSEEFKSITQERAELQNRNDAVDRRCAELERKLQEVKGSDIQGLRQQLKAYQEQKERCISNGVLTEKNLKDLEKELRELEKEAIDLLKKDVKGKRGLAKKVMAHDLLKVLEGSCDHLINVELEEASSTMNNIFMKMIGYEPEQSKIIKRVKISKEYEKCEILVYGPEERLLDPSRDLNGASRRALTLAFILALTKISEADAPNIIDTPLGMTSGLVKREMLKVAIQESKQLVLFLTHDEIKGCEDIINEKAGAQFTLTNSTHYPSMLVNDPGTNGENKVLLCNCGHNEDCGVCKRHPVSSPESN